MFFLFLIISDQLFCSATWVALCLALSSACMFSLFLLVLDHIFFPATRVALFPALYSACKFSIFHVFSDHLFGSATLAALCPALSSACMFSLFLVGSDHFFFLLHWLHCTQHYLLPVCILFSLLFQINCLFCYSGCTVSSTIFCMYVFYFSCCFRSFVLFCYSDCTGSRLSSACMFSLFLVVSDHLFCSATLVALCPALSSAFMFSLFWLFRINYFVLLL